MGRWAVAAAWCWMAACPALAAPQTVRMTTYLRAGPGPQYAALDEIDPESQVDVQSCDGGWCRVRSGRAAGFIRAEVLTAPDEHAKPPAPAAGAACLDATLNGRPRGGEPVRICNDK